MSFLLSGNFTNNEGLMLLRDKVQINSNPEVVWGYIASPDRLKSWNTKVKAIVPISREEWTEGFRYRVRYELYGREGNFLAEILEYKKPEKLIIHLTGGNMPVRGYVQEVYELSEHKDGTLLKLSFGIYNAGINIFSRSFIVISHLFGIKAGKKYLRKLKELVENRL